MHLKIKRTRGHVQHDNTSVRGACPPLLTWQFRASASRPTALLPILRRRDDVFIRSSELNPSSPPPYSPSPRYRPSAPRFTAAAALLRYPIAVRKGRNITRSSHSRARNRHFAIEPLTSLLKKHRKRGRRAGAHRASEARFQPTHHQKVSVSCRSIDYNWGLFVFFLHFRKKRSK